MSDTDDTHRCFICNEPFKAGEMVIQDETDRPPWRQIVSKIPEWAGRIATDLLNEACLTQLQHEQGVYSALKDNFALALVAAEKRGADAKAEALNVAERALKDWLHIYAPDLCDPAEVEAAKARVGSVGTIAYIADALAAIRQLGESHEIAVRAAQEGK